MEDVKKSIKETSIIDIKGKEKEVKNINTKVRKNPSSLVYVIPLVLIIISYCIFMFIYFDKSYSPNEIIEPNQDATTEEMPTEEESSETEYEVNQLEDDWDETLLGKISERSDGMKEYNNDIIGVRFTFPASWIAKEKSCSECADTEYGCTLCSVFFLENEEENSYFEYAYILETGYLPCYYSDTPKEYFDEDEMYDSSNMYGSDYTSIGESDEFRRTYISEEDLHRNFYRICRKGDSPSYYTNWIQPGFVLYRVNKDRDDLENILEIFDNIVLSFEYFGEKTY